jgi:N-methylhydantoinase A/oxoprolinase/acetone carboxylase beta subunit
MGASPGPACYGLGGSEATLTDVFLALGYLDAERFLGGRRKLDAAAARSAVERAISGPLKLSVARAAERVKDRAIQMVTALVGETVAAAGVKADALFAYGGNGPLFAPFLAERMEIATATVFFDLGAVFSAFGSEISDVVHLYFTTISSQGEREAAIQRLRGQAARDLRGEGFDPARAEMSIESDPGNEGTVRLRVVYPIASTEPQKPGRQSSDVAGAKIGERTIVLDGNDVRAPVYEAERLAPGHRLGGPVVVVAGSTTLVVPPLWKLEIDELGNGVLRR